MVELQLKNRRPYISYSQKTLFDKDPEAYKRAYLYGELPFKSDALLLGKEVAMGLEKDETDDIEIETLRMLMPTYPEKEFKIEVIIEGVPMLGKLDMFDPKKLMIGEVKTGKKWNQSMVNRHEQLKFYNLLVWAKYKRLAKDIKLFWIPTEVDTEGNVKMSARLFRTFETEHKLSDLLKYFVEVKRTWVAINKMWDYEIKKQKNVL